ncbi:unnamed protein product [Arctia plantaginis]|uniref:Peptidase S1 domain-containing protein n=1 Tax=Arctia plantaginis TaxID=874455 RepID=A0A8S0ZST8_ARCPL|nr:unnamed protein product [Arctia plantaginis]
MPQTSTVVLITKQLALATALEIDKFSKVDFREKSRVVLGHNCTLGPHLRVLEYAYHPDFNNNYYSALAMVQIKGTIRQEIIPICPPPTVFEEPDIYAMTLKHALSMSSCGIDNSPVNMVYEGQAQIETYPWLGILYYPIHYKRFTTAVVLVTRQLALAAASEIERLPKDDFRARARVVLGHNCSGPHLTIRDYSYHPEYSSKTFSALTMIQLETDLSDLKVRPICPPPLYFKNPQFFALVLSNDCRKSKIMIHKMQYVSPKVCRAYYRRSNRKPKITVCKFCTLFQLDVESLWPTHTACARSMSGGRCVWRSGAVLAIKSSNRWRLLGFGVYGPGCQVPSRFLDYGMYHKWVERNVQRIGRPTITTISDNHVIFRRMSGHIQRFGPCDREETVRELYSDRDAIEVAGYRNGHFSYNVSLYANVEYSCVTFRADHSSSKLKEAPKLHIQRWCAGSTGICFGFGYLSIHFRISVRFKDNFRFILRAYGQEAKIVDPRKAIEYINLKMQYPTIPYVHEVRDKMKNSAYGPYIYTV